MIDNDELEDLLIILNTHNVKTYSKGDFSITFHEEGLPAFEVDPPDEDDDDDNYDEN